MDWKEVAYQRRSQQKELEKQISDLEKKYKEIGDSNPEYVIADLLSKKYERVCRVEIIGHGMAAQKYLVLYKKNATKKQIQYKRHEVADVLAISGLDELFYRINGESRYASHLLPSDIDVVYEILTRQIVL